MFSKSMGKQQYDVVNRRVCIFLTRSSSILLLEYKDCRHQLFVCLHLQKDLLFLSISNFLSFSIPLRHDAKLRVVLPSDCVKESSMPRIASHTFLIRSTSANSVQGFFVSLDLRKDKKVWSSRSRTSSANSLHSGPTWTDTDERLSVTAHRIVC